MIIGQPVVRHVHVHQAAHALEFPLPSHGMRVATAPIHRHAASLPRRERASHLIGRGNPCVRPVARQAIGREGRRAMSDESLLFESFLVLFLGLALAELLEFEHSVGRDFLLVVFVGERRVAGAGSHEYRRFPCLTHSGRRRRRG